MAADIHHLTEDCSAEMHVGPTDSLL